MDTIRAYDKIEPGRYRECHGLYFDDFEVGTWIEHRPGRTLTEVDNVWQSLINMNPSPLHIDREHCRSTEWGRPLVSSLVTFSIVNGMTVRTMSARAVANLGWDKVRLTQPCFVGDTIYAESRVVSKRLSESRTECGIVTCETVGRKSDGTLFLTCERTFMVPTRDAPPLRHDG